MQTVARKNRVYLTGFMGSGKSTIGPILANTIGYEFIDIDRTIESREGTSVSDIFRRKGEAYFRVLERDAVMEVSARTRMVVSLGGGTLVDPLSFQIICSTGVIVYLKLTPEQLFRRVRRRNDRPMLTDANGDRLSDDELRVRIETLYREREPLYEKADITVLLDEKKVGVVVDQIVRRLSSLIE